MQSRPQSVWEKLGYGVAFVVVAGAAFRVSYSHIRELATWAGQPADVAIVLPLAVDGMMAIAALALRSDRAAERHARRWAIFGMWLGGLTSTVANVTMTVVHRGWDWVAVGVAAAAPIFLVVSIEIVSHAGKPKAMQMAAPEVQADDATAPDLPAAPVSPAPAGDGARAPYGPRNGDDYSRRHKSRLRSGR